MNTLINYKIGELEEWAGLNKIGGSGFLELSLPDGEYAITPIINGQKGFSGKAIYDYDKAPITIAKGLRRVMNPLGGQSSDYEKANMPELIISGKERVSAQLIWGLTRKRTSVSEKELHDASTNEVIHICDLYEEEEDYSRCGGAACSSLILVENEKDPIIFHFEIPKSDHLDLDYPIKTKEPRDVVLRNEEEWVEIFLTPTYNGLTQSIVWVPVLCSKDPLMNKKVLTKLSRDAVNVIGYNGKVIHTDVVPMSIIISARLYKKPAPCPPTN